MQDVHWFGLKLLRTFVHEEMSVIGWSDASWAYRREGSSQGGYIIGVANKTFLEQAESPISVILQSFKQQLTLRENSATFAFP